MKGSITRRGKKSWRIKFDVGRDPVTNRRKTVFKTIRGSKKDAERELASMLHALTIGGHVEPSRRTVAEYLKDWLSAHQTRVGAKTFERHQEIAEKHLIPALGSHLLQQLTALHVQKYYSDALVSGRRDGTGGLSARTVCHHHRVLHSALKQATRWRLTPRNVCEDVDPPKAKSPEIGVLDEKQIAAVLQAASTSVWHLPIFLAATTGLRRGEVLALRWCDVDLDRARLHVNRTLEQTKAGIRAKQPKTQRGRRTVTLPMITVELLRRHKAAQSEIRLALGQGRDEDALVFCDHTGNAHRPSNMTKAFEHIVARAGVPRVSLHALRHSHATQLLKSAVNPKVASERLGHASVAITLDIYSHVVPSMQEDAAKTIDTVLRTALEQKKTEA